MILINLRSLQQIFVLKKFVPTKKNRRRNKLYKEITSMLRNLVQGKANAINAGESKVDDLLDLLLQSNNQINQQENASSGMTIEEVIEECKAFYLAGQETTSSWLTWTIIVLAMHPDWQEKAREEVLQACQKKEPDYEALAHLKIVSIISLHLATTLMPHFPITELMQFRFLKKKNFFPKILKKRCLYFETDSQRTCFLH